MDVKIQTLFRILAILTMGRIFLPIVFTNIPFPFSSILVYTFLWVGGCILVYPDILISKRLRYIYLFIFVFVFGIEILWQDRIVGWGDLLNYNWLLSEIIPVFLAILIFTYFLRTKDLKGMAYVVAIALVFITITSLTSIIGLNKYPMAARELAGALTKTGREDLIAYYSSIGIASFGFFTALSFVFPVLIYKYKILWKNRFSYLWLIYGVMLLMFIVALIEAKYTMAIIFAFTFAIISLIKIKDQRKLIYISVCIVIIIISIPTQYISGLLYNVSELFEGTLTEERISDLAQTIENPVIDRAAETHVGSKLGRIPLLFESIISNPITGGGANYGHNFWLDRLSMFGIIGIIPWFLIIYNQLKTNLKILGDDFKPYYLLSMIAFISAGFINNMSGHQMFSIVFFVIPGIYFLKYINVRSYIDINKNKNVVS